MTDWIDHIVHKAKSIYYLIIYRKFASPDLIKGLSSYNIMLTRAISWRK